MRVNPDMATVILPSPPPTPLRPGLHHDLVSEALLEGRQAGLSELDQQEHDLRRATGQENLGTRCVFRPLQEVIHPRHHD